MIISRRRGFAIALITMGCLAGSEALCRAAFSDNHYYQEHNWPKLLGFWAAACAIFALGPWLGVGKERIMIDKATAREERISYEGSLFFVPARYWPVILAGLGVAYLFR